MAFWCVGPVLVSFGWSLESLLVLGSYLLIALLYLLGGGLFLFGIWQLGLMSLNALMGLPATN